VEFLGGDSKNPSRGEGEDVELGARTSKHILVFAFGYFSLNSTLFISYIAIIVHLFMLGCIDPRELLKHLNSYKRGILRRSSKALHREFDFTL